MGVDTHGDVHVAHAGDQLGCRLDTVSVPTTPSGYRGLLAWARGLGELDAWGVEGTGAYGVGLARFLRGHGQVVVAVNRPDRAARRRRGKSDPFDAEAAARAVQAGEATVLPKAGTGQVGDAPRAAGRPCQRHEGTHPGDQRRQGAAGHRAGRSAPAAPGPVGHPARRDRGAAASRRDHDPTAAAKLAVRTLACRHQALSAEIKDLDTELDRLTAKAAGDNPDRLRWEAAFSMLCGSSPIEASSGKTVGHRPRPWRRPPGRRRAVPDRDGAPAL